MATYWSPVDNKYVSNNSSSTDHINNFTGHNYQEHIVQGKMLTAELVVDRDEFEVCGEQAMKERLIALLIQEAFKAGCIEFTVMIQPEDFRLSCKARAFITPKDTVQIIRTVKK